jgi:hypothetical protein
MSPRVRGYLARRLTIAGPLTPVSKFLVTMHRLRHLAHMRVADHALVRTVHGVVVAQVRTDLAPLLARQHTLTATTTTLAAGGVAFFCVRGYGDLSTAVAVDERDRTAVMRALRSASRRSPSYLADVVERRPGALRSGRRRRTYRRLSRAGTVRLVRFFTDPTGSLVLGEDAGCDIEFWRERAGRWQSPRPNRAADVVTGVASTVHVPESALSRLVGPETPGLLTLPSRPEMLGDLIDDITFPIDVVYTWVDGADPAWRSRRDAVRGLVTEDLNHQSANESRYISRDELRYSLRSLHLYAPWVRHIWIVTDEQTPAWLDTQHPRVSLVSHKELFAARGTLPTFNSHAIETQLHHIDPLSEHFLYFNDDVLLGRPVIPQLFFQANGLTKLFPSRAKVDPGQVDVVADIPSTAAGKNNRELVQEAFGRSLTFKMKHVPHALRRGILSEMDTRFADRVNRTARHQFRHPDDISMASSLYQHYAYLTGRAAIDTISYMYVDLAAADTPGLLRLALAKRNFDVYCLNDTDTDPASMRRQEKVLREFLTAHYPVPAPWELP